MLYSNGRYSLPVYKVLEHFNLFFRPAKAGFFFCNNFPLQASIRPLSSCYWQTSVRFLYYRCLWKAFLLLRGNSWGALLITLLLHFVQFYLAVLLTHNTAFNVTIQRAHGAVPICCLYKQKTEALWLPFLKKVQRVFYCPPNSFLLAGTCSK